jgi:hypothetical protein
MAHREAVAFGADAPPAPAAKLSVSQRFGRFVGRHRFAVGVVVVLWLGSSMAFVNSLERASTKKSGAGQSVDHAATRALAGASALKSLMRDPSSFRVETAIVMDDGAACYSYRANNGFGGVNVGSAVLPPKVDTILTDEMPGFEDLWNRHCAKKTGRDASAAIRMYGR